MALASRDEGAPDQVVTGYIDRPGKTGRWYRVVAEGVGFEPTRALRPSGFQDRPDTRFPAPLRRQLYRLALPTTTPESDGERAEDSGAAHWARPPVPLVLPAVPKSRMKQDEANL